LALKLFLKLSTTGCFWLAELHSNEKTSVSYIKEFFKVPQLSSTIPFPCLPKTNDIFFRVWLGANSKDVGGAAKNIQHDAIIKIVSSRNYTLLVYVLAEFFNFPLFNFSALEGLVRTLGACENLWCDFYKRQSDLSPFASNDSHERNAGEEKSQREGKEII
jgi:hypothetical protein